MRRRETIFGLGSMAAWPILRPLVAHAQQPGVPVIGFLDTSSLASSRDNVSDFRTGLRDAGYIEGQNVAIEFRWADNKPIMPQLARDLVRLQVAVIVASGGVRSALAAKAATSTLPIVVAGGADPVKYGLVESLGHPGGNITGITFIHNELAGKRLDLLLQMMPEATIFGYLAGNPTNGAQQEERAALLAAARIVGREIIIRECSAISDFENAFSTLVERHANAVIVSAFPLAFNNRNKILGLAAYHKIPAIYSQRQYVYEGGLMSYNAASAMHQLAIEYVARILKGEKPADLPLRRPTKFQLIVNRKTAKTLGLEIPPILMVMADQIVQ